MRNRTLIYVFLCILVFSFTALTEDIKPGALEFLARKQIVHPNLFVYIPSDYTQSELFNSETLLTLSIPPSPKSDTIFIQFEAQNWCKWTSHEFRRNSSSIFWELKSDLIPEDIIIYEGMTLTDIDETNFAGDYSRDQERTWRTTQHMINRDSTLINLNGEVFIQYRGGGGPVPNEIAVPLLNDLFDNGFDIEVHVEGAIQGSRYYRIVAIRLDVTRVAKDKIPF